MIKLSRNTIITGLIIVFAFNISCRKKSIRYLKKPIPLGSSVGVIFDVEKETAKNTILAKFMARGYNVKAVNASDLYSIKDVFDIKDLKRISLSGSAKNSLVSMERTINNIYKLHLYNFEVNKVKFLNELKTKWKIQYIILMDLKNWEGVSWGRAINLNTNELVWVENYPTVYGDDIDSVVDHFITSMSRK